MCVCVFFVFFFFQAEDGIRDLVRSRGLGDVYKRQDPIRSAPTALTSSTPASMPASPATATFAAASSPRASSRSATNAVSYTHLTLPTSDLV